MRAALASRHGVERHVARWEELLEDDGLDVVSVAVPTFLHAPITVAALERGLHVLSEKPIARTPEEAATMVEAARGAGRVLDVAFNHRQRGDIQTLKRVIDAGRLGTPYYAKAWWLRRTGIPTLGQLVHERRQGRRRAAAGHRRPRARLLAVPARPAADHCRLGVDLRPAGKRRLRLRPGDGEERRHRREDVRRRGPGDGLHAARGRRDAAGRGELGRAPHGRRRVRDHDLRHRGRRRADRARHGADRVAADLHRRGGRGGRDRR